MLPGFKCATSLSVFVIVCFCTWGGDVLFPQVLLPRFKVSSFALSLLHMSELGWNGNFLLHTFTEESKKVLLPLC